VNCCRMRPDVVTFATSTDDKPPLAIKVTSTPLMEQVFTYALYVATSINSENVCVLYAVVGTDVKANLKLVFAVRPLK
jgi:hypothetical protein